MELKKLEQAEKSILFCGGFAVLVILSFNVNMSLNISTLGGLVFSINIISLLLMVMLTLSPYYVFYKISQSQHKKINNILHYKWSVFLAMCVSFFAVLSYYNAWQGMEADHASSTSAVIFGVLPIYILIGGAMAYGLLSMDINRNA